MSCPDFRWLLLQAIPSSLASNFWGQVWHPFGNAKTHRMHQCGGGDAVALAPIGVTLPHHHRHHHLLLLRQPLMWHWIEQTTTTKPTIWLSQWELQHLETTTSHLGRTLQDLLNLNLNLILILNLSAWMEHKVATSSSSRSRNQRVETVPSTLPSRVRILSTCVAVCFNGQFLTLNGCRPVSCQRPKARMPGMQVLEASCQGLPPG